MPLLTLSTLVTAGAALTAQAVPVSVDDSATVAVNTRPTEAPLVPDTVLTYDNGPTILLDTAPGIPTTAMRLAFPIGPETAPTVVHEVVRELAEREMWRRARETGATVRSERTAWGLVYEVVGAAPEVEHLAYVLRGVLDPTLPERLTLQRIVSELAQDLAEERERPGAVLRGRLLEAEGRIVPLNALEALQTLRPTEIERALRDAHRLESAVLTIVTPEEPAVALSSLNFPANSPPTGNASDDRALDVNLSIQRPQVLRRWYGESYELGAVTDPAAPVLAILLEERIAPSDGRTEVFVELRPDGGENLLLVYGAAYSGRFDAMRSQVRSLLSELVASLDATAFERARAEARFRLRLGARSSSGMAATIGRFHEAIGVPSAALDYSNAVDALELADLRRLLDRLIAQEPTTAQVRP